MVKSRGKVSEWEEREVEGYTGRRVREKRREGER